MDEGRDTRGPITDRTPALVSDVMPPELRESAGVAVLRRKLLWLAFTRIATMLILVAATTLITGDVRLTYLRGIRTVLIWVGIMGLIPSALYFPALYSVQTLRGLRTIAFLMMTQDCLFAAIMVGVTGGTQSAFTFFFSLTIILASVIVGRGGTLFSALVSCAFLGAMGLYETRVLTTPTFLGDFLIQGSVYSVLSSIGINVVGFAAVGFLSNYLAEQVRRSDIQRERYRVSLEDLRQLHQSILTSVASGIVTCRLDHRVLHMNRAAEAFLGVSDRRARGRLLREVFPEAADAVASSRTVFEAERRTEGGRSRSLLVTVTPLMSAAGQMFGRILAVEDVSLIKHMEARLKAEERLATLGKLAAVVAHEIRNPLAAISASAQMIGLSGGLAPDEKQAVGIVIREAERLNLWVSDLLDYARPKVGEKAPVRVADLLSEVVEVVRADPAAARIEVDLDVEPDATVFGDSHRLYRVFLNLARNAVEAMPDGGRLRVAAWREPGEVPGMTTVVVTVTDNGHGIPREDLDKVFDAFFTTKSGGTGLGLAVVARVVEEHGGRVEVWSDPNVGTRFSIRLPEYSVSTS